MGSRMFLLTSILKAFKITLVKSVSTASVQDSMKTLCAFFRSFFIYSVMTLLICPSYAFADMELFDQLERISAQINNVGSKDSKCDLSAVSLRCSMDSQCSSYAHSSLFSYKDSRGYSLPNGPMLTMVNALEGCLEEGLISQSIDNPFLYPEKFSDPQAARSSEKLKQNKRRFNQESKRAQKIFKEAKNKIIQVLKQQGGATNPNLQNLISRVESLPLGIVSPINGLERLAEEGCESPNAFYSTIDHQVFVCPQILDMPESSIFFALSHEIAHAIGPCSTAFDLKNGLEYPEWMDYGQPKGRKKADKIQAEAHPFKGVFQCLQSPQSIGARSPDMRELVTDLRVEEQQSLNDSDTKMHPQIRQDYKNQIDWISSNYESIKSCSEFSGSGHIEEASADWFAAQAVSLKLQELPTPAAQKEYAHGATGIMASIQGCPASRQAVSQLVDSRIDGKCFEAELLVANASTADEVVSKTHPKIKDRIDKIFMAQPEVRKALQCKENSSVNPCP